MSKVLILGILVLLIVLFSGCAEQEQSTPIGELMTQYTSTNNNYDNFVIYVNMTVKNIGDRGKLTVWTYVRQGIHVNDEKRQTLFFESGETKSISFAFSEGFKLGGSWIHYVGVTP